MAENQQQQQSHSHIRLQYSRYLRHKDRSRNYKTIQSGISVTIRNYNGIKSITTRNYRKIA